MHEVSLMENTLDIALQHASQQGANKIHRLKMRVGAMSGVVPEALEFAFDVVARNTIAEGAKFEIEQMPVVCYCTNCQTEFKPEDLIYECPQCHQLSHDIRSGREIELTTLEVS
ncbi:hydrogenase maturation nickel metallochaperone HypA [Phormidium sp. CCY1219]|jgi:hydrogenase nickel incorporation protein HypA/HybF|uniref:hydrogenase maturation nickel metallochaperone HypA n=1 Tax=Phormidium sp. CCY1219 TaxID=2886104 RepID=UPI002D1F92FA|nr:hydrogenase maturation nickel metallochaperone HypA [Phormidium sp. CCY1219]MEB3827456.1 hydrogenase maturation nickel metallochaperone HypA [Phormidium sp. CCY1219]